MFAPALNGDGLRRLDVDVLWDRKSLHVDISTAVPVSSDIHGEAHRFFMDRTHLAACRFADAVAALLAIVFDNAEQGSMGPLSRRCNNGRTIAQQDFERVEIFGTAIRRIIGSRWSGGCRA